jgi:NADP-dependent 3-hydroxy acid dehydrogenase YdfG
MTILPYRRRGVRKSCHVCGSARFATPSAGNTDPIKDTENNMAQQDDTANQQKGIQNRQDQADASKQKGESGGSSDAAQTGVNQPSGDFPSQHLAKPGLEAQMELKPKFMADGYKGSGKLAGQTAIITGADSGIGRAVAVLFAREGADVAILYLNEHEDAAETQRCCEAEGTRCVTIAGDVRDMEFCQQAVDQVVAKFGRLDVLVNNAAFQEHAESLLDLTEDRFDMTMKTNIYGYFHMAKASLPYMKRGAAIVNTGSVTGLKGSKKLLDYSTTKGAIHAFTMALAANLLDKGIRGPGLDSAQPGRPVARRDQQVRPGHHLRPPGPAGRAVAGLCLPGLERVLGLCDGRGAADHGFGRRVSKK